jgi:hypothetical protein
MYLRTWLLERERQDLLGTWSKITDDCTFDAGGCSLALLKIDLA